MSTIFWISVFVVIYTFLGYGVVITLLAKFKGKKEETLEFNELPDVTLLVAAYNEEEIIEEKINNCLELDYPSTKLTIAFVTDGSNDKTQEIIESNPEIKLFHQNKRAGKIAAVNRVMEHIDSSITVFSDANVMINKDGLANLVRRFSNAKTGAVSGEKVVLSKKADGASASGEGFYWKYESFLKKQDAQWNSLVGSAGEFFGIRTSLYEKIDESTLIEDFVMTMKLASKGYKVDYAEDAIAAETASLNIAEETKRKVRISAGGIQAVLQLKKLLNPFKYGKLSFQYISHRVLRWTLMPMALIGAYLTNLWLLDQGMIYQLSFMIQTIFYVLAFCGYAMRNNSTRIKMLYIPYYFVYMHICVVKGWIKYFSGNQKVTWEKSKRAAQLETTISSAA